MVFEYSEYRDADLIWPLLVTAFNLYLIVGSICAMVRSVKKAEDIRLNMVRGITSLVLVLFLLVVGSGPLFIGGFHLIYEREDDAEVYQGTIEKIEEYPTIIANSSKYTTEYGTTFGNRLTIDGQIYNIVTSGEFEVGDEVFIRFLPNSRYILEITEIEEYSIHT